MRVKVLIPMYGFNSMTDECVELCRKNAGIEHDILVVDDGSAVPYENKDVEVLRLPQNSGFSRAVNAGLRHLNCNYDYVCILNNDTKPCEDFLKHLVCTASSDPSIGITGAGRITNNGNEYLVFMWQEDLTTGSVAAVRGDIPNPEQCVSIPFCCVLLSRDCVQTVGLLDAKMVNYSSDTDYCLRTLMLGFCIVFEPKAKVFHYQSVTCHDNNVPIYGDQKIFMEKWFGVAMNEILAVIPINHELKKYGRIMLAYDSKETYNEVQNADFSN